MPAYYSLVQYVPDLLKNERVNIGVVVFVEGRAESHFIENWARVRQFGANVGALQDVAKQIEHMPWERLKDAMTSWQQSIQFTPPAASMLDLDALLVDMAERCLVDPAKHERTYRARHEAIAITKKLLASALGSEIGKAAKKLIRPHYPMAGRLDKHECDLAVVNGRPYVAVNSLSFEIPETRDLIKEISAVKWVVDDIKQAQPDFPIVLTALPPKQPSMLYDHTIHTFKELGAVVVPENMLERWSQEIAANVRNELKGD